MNTVTSRDGTKIGYDTQGQGSTLILVDGALCTRSSGSKPELVKLLAPHFTVYSYDRRGRGDSGDTLLYAVEREIEDLEALITEAGQAIYLYGHSSGAALVLEAAVKLGNKVKKLAIYEVPYNDQVTAQQAWKKYIEELSELLTQERGGDAVALFMKLVGTPAEQIEGMRHSPVWPELEALGSTLAYDHTALLGENGEVPTELATRVKIPALVMNGAESFPFMYDTALTLNKAIPDATLRTLKGQNHNVRPEVLVPELIEFFAGA